jgi:hypothetical protein
LQVRIYRRHRRQGQSTVETLLLTSVLVIAIVWVAGDALWPRLGDGLQSMQDRISAMSEDGVVDGH